MLFKEHDMLDCAFDNLSHDRLMSWRHLQRRQREPSQAKAVTRKELGAKEQHTAEEASSMQAGRKVPLIPGVDQEAKVLTPGELDKGVLSMKDVFPDIHQTVAELTLKVGLPKCHLLTTAKLAALEWLFPAQTFPLPKFWLSKYYFPSFSR